MTHKLEEKVVVKADERLFNEIKEICDNMKTTLPSIVQNDMEISVAEYQDFVSEINYYMDRIFKWAMDV